MQLILKSFGIITLFTSTIVLAEPPTAQQAVWDDTDIVHVHRNTSTPVATPLHNKSEIYQKPNTTQKTQSRRRGAAVVEDIK